MGEQEQHVQRQEDRSDLLLAQGDCWGNSRAEDEAQILKDLKYLMKGVGSLQRH